MTQQPSHASDLPAVPQASIITWWRRGRLSLLDVARRSAKSFRKHQLDARSAQFAYYCLLALAPLLIVLIALIVQFPIAGLMGAFLDAVDEGLPKSAVRLIASQVTEIQQQSSIGLIAAGLVLFALAGSRVFLTLGRGIDRIWGEENRRRYLRARGLALLLAFGVLLLLLLAMIVLVVGPLVTKFVFTQLHISGLQVILTDVLRWVVACLFMLTATSVIYWTVPTRKLPWALITPGTLFATAAWVAATQGFRLYIENVARINETYGALGGVVVLMIWLYLTGAILLMGAQIDYVIRQDLASKPAQEPIADQSA
jgi:membrane protein